MSVSPENDPDGVVAHDTDEDVHENTRRSTEGVETRPPGEREPATGLIGGGASGIGEMDDPRQGIIAP